MRCNQYCWCWRGSEMYCGTIEDSSPEEPTPFLSSSSPMPSSSSSRPWQGRARGAQLAQWGSCRLDYYPLSHTLAPNLPTQLYPFQNTLKSIRNTNTCTHPLPSNSMANTNCPAKVTTIWADQKYFEAIMRLGLENFKGSHLLSNNTVLKWETAK